MRRILEVLSILVISSGVVTCAPIVIYIYATETIPPPTSFLLVWILVAGILSLLAIYIVREVREIF